MKGAGSRVAPWLLASACLAANLCVPAQAADDVRSRPLVLYPPGPSPRALRYALLPELNDAVPDNAVDHYRQAIKNMKQDAPPSREWYPALEQWMAAPLKDLPRDEVGKFLSQCESTFREADLGARSEGCDWGLTAELRRKGFATLLPDVQHVREIAALLTLRVRYELAEGRIDKAVHALQTGFAVARHVADAPTLIHALVGMAITGLMVQRLEEVIQQPDAPSFFWPLTDLPRPLIDLRKPMQGERVGAYGSFPGATEMAADLNAKPWTPEQVEKVVSIFRQLTNGDNPFLEVKEDAELLLRIAARHEAGKKVLIAEGRPKELVDAMPHVQVALLVALRQYEKLLDELEKCQSLPFWEGQPLLEQAEARVKQESADADGPAVPLARMILPAVRKVYGARTRVDRQIAALRCVEAVRLYVAAHEGKPPASLDDVKDVPVPADPVTGKPFGYRLVGDRAFFSSTPFPGQPGNNATTPTYELIFKP